MKRKNNHNSFYKALNVKLESVKCLVDFLIEFLFLVFEGGSEVGFGSF